MAKTEETFDDYIANAELYKIDVTKLDLKKARWRFLRYNFAVLLIYQIFCWGGIFGFSFFLYPHFAKIFILPIIILLSLILFILGIQANWKPEVSKVPSIIAWIPISIACLIYFTISIFHPYEYSNDMVQYIGIAAPWSYLLFLLSIVVYLKALHYGWKDASAEKSLKTIYDSKCIDFERKLYTTDLDDRKFENYRQPTGRDRILVRGLIGITPFIQFGILRSTGNGSTSAIIFFVGLYFFSLLLNCTFFNAFRNYQAIKKIQKDLGYRLTPIKSDRKQASFWSMGWYR